MLRNILQNSLLLVFTLTVTLLLMNFSTISIYGQDNSNATIQLFNGQNLDGWYTF